jgi:putative tricarboxylic transport membrane protein
MDLLNNLASGFVAAMSQANLIACFVGVMIGTIIGVLPGIGPVGAMALLLPFSFGMDPAAGLIMLAGIYYGSMYGGSTTSILLNVPGEAVSIVTCMDGYQMARKGRAGAALAIAAIGSFVAGTAGIVGLMLFAPALGNFALAFGPPEYFAVSLLGIILLSNLSGGSFLKSFLMVIVGMMISTIGIDTTTGFNRFDIGVFEMARGIELLPVAMGAFGLAEILATTVEPYNPVEAIKVRFRELYPDRSEIKRSLWPIARGSFIGFPMGVLPGPAAVIASLASYKIERSVSPHPEEFGKGAIEGVAGPESANNSASAGAMVPLLALGIPFNAATALLLGGLMIHGISPGPLFITEHAGLFWQVIASMYIGNLILLVLNLPLVGVFASIMRAPVSVLMPTITAIMLIGAFSVNNSSFDLWLLLVFGVLGFIMKRIDFQAAPLVIGLVLGVIFEQKLRQGLMMVDGNFLRFFERPVTATLLVLALIMLLWSLAAYVRKKVR